MQLTKGAVEDHRAEAEEASRRVRELEEQIQSDDRAERAEAALQNVQDRATELELQLSKLKQVYLLLCSHTTHHLMEALRRIQPSKPSGIRLKESLLLSQNQSLLGKRGMPLSRTSTLS